MEEAAADLGNLFRAITIQLASLTSAVHSQGVANIVPTFSGKPSEFKNWIKAIQRYEILTRVDDEKLKGITLQTAQGPVADFIARWMSDHQDQNWAQLRAELQSRFGELTDRTLALSMLRRVKQDRNESVQIFAERLLSIAEDAFQGQGPADLNAIERQLVGFFIDGLAFDYLKMKVMRENPDRLQVAVHIAMSEQNLKRRFNLRTGRDERNVEPMEVAHTGPKRCQLCHRLGHEARACRNTRRERAEAVSLVRNSSCNPNRQLARRGSSARRRPLICWHCFAPGHLRSNCEEYKRYMRTQEAPEAQRRPVGDQSEN